VSDGRRGDAAPRTGILPPALRQHPAPRFLIVGFFTFLVDIGSLGLLHSVLHVELAISTVVAYAIAFSVNFFANRQWTFATTALGTKAQHQMVRYLVLVAFNLCLTLLIVLGLSSAGVPYLLAKVISVCIIAVGNFFAYRHWVFATQPGTIKDVSEGESTETPPAEDQEPQSATSTFKSQVGALWSQMSLGNGSPVRAETSDPATYRTEDLPRRRRWTQLGPEVLTLLAVLFNLWILRTERLPVAYPNDSSVHLQMVTLAGHLLSSGQFPLDHWYQLLSLGSPYFVQYQSASAILTGALGQLVGYQQAFSWTLYLLLSLWPLCIYWSARLLGFSRWTSAATAAISPLLFTVTGYGYGDQSYIAIGNGLWSQLWAMWSLPLAWGFSWRFVSQRRYLFGAVSTLALTIAFHFLTAYLAGLSLMVFVLARPREIVRRLSRSVLVGIGALFVTLWVTLPLLVDSKWVAVNPFQVGTFWDDSYGARKILGWLVTGQLYDYGRFPVVTILGAIGLLACLVRFRKDERARIIVGLWVLSLLLYFGRPTLGPVLNLLPGNSNLFFQRFIAGVQLAGLFLAGIGAVALVRLTAIIARTVARKFVDRLSSRPVYVALRPLVAILALVLVLTPAWTEAANYAGSSSSWIHYQQNADETQGVEVNTLVAIAKADGGGRIYAGLPSNWGYGFTVGEVPVYIYLNDIDADSVGFTLRTTSLMTAPEAYFDESNLGDYATFGVRYLLLPEGHPPPVPATLLTQLGEYKLWTVKGSTQLIQVVDTTSTITANGGNIGGQTESFLDSDLPAKGLYATIAYGGQPAAAPTLPAGTSAQGPAGTVTSERIDLAQGRAVATIFARRTAVVLLKASFDPGWTVTVDGEPATTEMVAPALVGVTVSPGQHTVVFQFRGYASYPLLFGIALLALIVFGVLPTLWRRNQKRLRRGKTRDDVSPEDSEEPSQLAMGDVLTDR
jgi:putative flippase GtrA